MKDKQPGKGISLKLFETEIGFEDKKRLEQYIIIYNHNYFIQINFPESKN